MATVKEVLENDLREHKLALEVWTRRAAVGHKAGIENYEKAALAECDSLGKLIAALEEELQH